ncbi:MAG: hypothetical protein NWE79_09240, partial [Candidatus Bathyarchaeota archaeon]|nr:hypothetical protein [Candidatus Bathyarchaeota archaeon]
EALREIDSVVAKLDAGCQETYEAVNRPAAGVPPLRDIVGGLMRLQEETGRVTLQTLVFRSTAPAGRDNASEEEIKLIAEEASSIDPIEIQVYTVSRYPLEPFVEPVEGDILRETAHRINYVTGRKCATTYI